MPNTVLMLGRGVRRENGGGRERNRKERNSACASPGFTDSSSLAGMEWLISTVTSKGANKGLIGSVLREKIWCQERIHG